MSTVPLDLTDLASVRQCGQLLLDQGADFDVVLNNAGVEGRGLDRAEVLQHREGFSGEISYCIDCPEVPSAPCVTLT